METLEFVKYPILETDTIEGLAEQLEIAPDYLRLAHNVNVDEARDKISSFSGPFPKHLTEIFISQEAYNTFVERQNEKRPKNNDYLEYYPIKEKKTYEVLYAFLEGENPTQISFQTSIQAIEDKSNKNGHTIEIDRNIITEINQNTPEQVVDELALATAKVIYPLQIILDYRGVFVKIKNHQEILNRWEIIKENVQQDFESSYVEQYLSWTDDILKTPETLAASLKKDWFFRTYFDEIYTSYYPKYKLSRQIKFPILSNHQESSYTAVQEMNKYTDDPEQLSISQKGTVQTEKNTTAVKGYFEAKYSLDPTDNSIKNITLECALDYIIPKKLSIVVTQK